MLRLAREHEVLITVEEGSIGGFGSHVLQTLAEHGALDSGLQGPLDGAAGHVHRSRYARRDVCAGRLDAKGIVAKVFEALGKDLPVQDADGACVTVEATDDDSLER